MNLKEWLGRLAQSFKSLKLPKPDAAALQSLKDPSRLKRLASKKVLFPALAALFALVFLLSFVRDHVSCVGGFPVFQKTKKKAKEKPQEEIPIPVKVYKVAKVNFRDTLVSLGTIKGFHEIDLKFSTSGYAEYINFKEGERITQGDIIASLDQKEALLKLEYAKIELEKQTNLYELGSILEAKLKQSQLEYQSAKAEFDKTNLLSPSDGYIGSLAIDKGSYVTPNDKVAVFVDLKDVYVEFGVIEKDVPKIKEGQNVEVVVESFPDQVFKGQVESVSPVVEPRSRTVQVRSRIANVDEKIKPGMFGRVNVLVYEKEQAIVIPAAGFKKKEDQYFVYLVHPEEPSQEAAAAEAQAAAPQAGEAPPAGVPEEPEIQYGVVEVRPIEISYATPDAVEIKEGLDEGDMIAMDVEQDLQEKAKVEITETQEGIF